MQRLRQPEPPVRFRGRGGVVSERTCCMEGRGGCLWLAQWQVKKKTTRFSVSFFIEKCGHEQGLPHSGAVRLRGTSVLADGPESWRRGNSFALNIEISSGNQKNNHTFWCGYFRGGLEGIRTLDLSDANRTLSQLSYEPICALRQRQMLLYHNFFLCKVCFFLGENFCCQFRRHIVK